GNAFISNEILTVNAPGMISIEAIQEGNSDFFPAENVQQSFYAKKTQEINFPTIDSRVYDAGSTQIFLTASSNADLLVSFELVSGNGTITGNIFTILEPGPVTIKSQQN